MKKVKVILELNINDYDVKMNDILEEEICGWFEFNEMNEDIDVELEDIKIIEE